MDVQRGRSQVRDAKNNEPHVCGRRRGGEPAVLKGEAYTSHPPAPSLPRQTLFPFLYGEPLSAARTKLADFFNILLMKIGVISDTHGLLDEGILPYFEDVEHILHAGDIGRLSIIERLERIAPITAVSGNVDGFEESGFPRESVIDLAGWRIALCHRLYEGGAMTREGRAFLERARPRICVFGHTHQPIAKWVDGILLFNPGSAGPKRFSLPRGIGLLLIHDRTIEPVHIALPDRA